MVAHTQRIGEGELGLDTATLAHRLSGDVAKRRVSALSAVAAHDVSRGIGEDAGQRIGAVELDNVVVQKVGGLQVFLGCATIDARPAAFGQESVTGVVAVVGEVIADAGLHLLFVRAVGTQIVEELDSAARHPLRSIVTDRLEKEGGGAVGVQMLTTQWRAALLVREVAIREDARLAIGLCRRHRRQSIRLVGVTVEVIRLIPSAIGFRVGIILVEGVGLLLVEGDVRSHVDELVELVTLNEVILAPGACLVVTPDAVEREDLVVMRHDLGAPLQALVPSRIGHSLGLTLGRELQLKVESTEVFGEGAGVADEHRAAGGVLDLLGRVENDVKVAALDDVDALDARNKDANRAVGEGVARPVWLHRRQGLNLSPGILLPLKEGLGALVGVVIVVTGQKLLILGQAKVGENDDHVDCRREELHIAARRLVLFKRGGLGGVTAVGQAIHRADRGHTDDGDPNAAHVGDRVGRREFVEVVRIGVVHILPVEVGRQERIAAEARHLIGEVVGAHVELVVAHHARVVAHHRDPADLGLARVGVEDRRTLEIVAGIEKQGAIRELSFPLDQGGHTRGAAERRGFGDEPQVAVRLQWLQIVRQNSRVNVCRMEHRQADSFAGKVRIFTVLRHQAGGAKHRQQGRQVGVGANSHGR